MKIKINSDDNLPLGKTLNMQNVVTPTKSVFNKNCNHYYYETFLEKFSFNIKMLYYARIDVSQSINVKKTTTLKSVLFVTIGIF